jgi:hypothetical protein
MQTPTPSPFLPTPYVAACHAGQAARADFAAHLARLDELERHGRDVLRRYSPSQLAVALEAAVYVEQLEGRLAALDLDEIEDLSGLIQRLEHEDAQARAV